MKLFTKLSNDEHGSATIISVMALMIVLAFGAFAVDLAYVYLRATKMANVSDASAISGSISELPLNANSSSGGYNASKVANAKAATIAIADINVDDPALTSGGGNPAVLPSDVEFGYWDPTAASDSICSLNGGSFAAGANAPFKINGAITGNAVRVAASHNQAPLFLAGLIGLTDTNVNRCAVAEKSHSKTCFYVLSPNPGAWTYNGNMTINATTCAIGVNGGISGVGNSNEVYSPHICTDGGEDGGLNTYLPDGSPVPITECGGLDNPYADLTYTSPVAPVITDIDNTYTGGGVINGDHIISNSKNLVLSNGTYVIDGGQLEVKGSITTSNATIVLKNGGSLRASASGNVTLAAATGGDTADFAIIQDDGVVSTESCGGGGQGAVCLGGNGVIDIDGVVYVKDGNLDLQGGPDYNLDGTNFVVYSMEISGNGTINIAPKTPVYIFTETHLVQ